MPAASKAPRRARAAGKLPVRHIGPQSGPHAGTTAGGEQCPWDAAGFDFNRMKQAVSYTQKLKKNGAATLLSRVEVFEYACVDQETIISYDPRRFAERPDGPSTALPDLPDIAWSDDLLYFYRQASQRAAHEALGADSPYAEDPQAQLRDRVVGRLLRAWPNIEARLASPEEVQAAPNFSHCTVPLVVSAFWPNTLCEFFARVPGAFHYHQQAGNLSPNMTIVLVNPLKLAPARFNYDIMRAFSSLEPISFAELSARHPPSTPSRSTFEGTHVRCFRHLVVWKANQDNFRGRLPTVGKAVAAYYSSQLRRSPPFWLSLRPPRPGVMRILFEQRNVGNARMLIGFDSLLRACAASKRPFGGSSWRRLHASGNAPGADDWRRGWGGRPASVECQSYALGSRPFVQDLAVLQETDVLVATHGSGEMNAVFMPYQSSVVEVRGSDADKLYANQWHPFISTLSGYGAPTPPLADSLAPSPSLPLPPRRPAGRLLLVGGDDQGPGLGAQPVAHDGGRDVRRLAHQLEVPHVTGHACVSAAWADPRPNHATSKP